MCSVTFGNTFECSSKRTQFLIRLRLEGKVHDPIPTLILAFGLVPQRDRKIGAIAGIAAAFSIGNHRN
jgi:hypothetical protein